MVGGALALITVLGLAACGAAVARDHRNPAVTINDAHPVYRGVHLGSPISEVVRRFGRPPANKSIYDTPGGVDPYEFGLPVFGAPTPPPRPPIPKNRPRSDLHDLRYRSVLFDASTTHAGVYGIEVIAPGTETSRGVRIGDSLARARMAYAGILHCGIADQGTTYPSVPYCDGPLGPHLHIYFGQDPIRSIVFASTFV